MRASTTSKAPEKKYYRPNESRRGFIRVDFEPGSKIGIDTPTGQTSYDALDISVYGVSFLASPGDSGHFAMGTELGALAFVINGRQIVVRGKVAYLHTGLIAGLSKVAVEFTHVPIDDVWYLSRYVAEKAGVHKPGQIGTGMIEYETPRAKKKTKAKTKAKTKPKAKRKTSKPRGKRGRR
jgi:hypothetical protein